MLINKTMTKVEKKELNSLHSVVIVSWSDIRIMGVLQRLSLTYLVVSALELLFTRPLQDGFPQVTHRLVLFSVYSHPGEGR